MRRARGTRRRGWLLAAAKLAVSASLLVLLARRSHAAEVWASVQSIPPAVFVAAWTLLLAQSLILGLRWWLVMDALGAPLGYARTVRLTFVGAFFNQVLPTSFGGDAVRIWQAYRSGVRPDAAINGVALERVSGLVGLALMVAVGLWWFGPRIDSPGLRLGLLAAVPLVMLGIGLAACLDRMPETWRKWRAARGLVRLAADTRRIFIAPTVLAPLLLLSLVSHGLAALAVYAFADGLGLAVTAWECLALVPPVILITLFPVSFAGWGVREGAMVTMLAFAGIGAEAALAVSLAFGGALLAAALPGCILWLAGRATTAAQSAA